MEKIDIIMGVFNCEKFLSDSIDSLLEQTFEDWKLIVCDDNSTDGTKNIIKRYRKKYPDKIIMLENKKNMGLNYTLNKCLKYTNAEYIARQDGDDISLKNRLEKEVLFLEKHKQYAMVSSNMIFFDESGEWGRSKNVCVPDESDFINGSPFCHAPCMIRREIMFDLGGYSEDKNTLRVEDYDLWFRMYQKGYKGYNFSECLYKMRNDKTAAKRRTVRNRINEFKLKRRIYKSFGKSKKDIIKVVAPLVKVLTPMFVYRFVYNKKYKNK